ncbi:MAG: hypothetical protein A2504_03295 [Bdellovibrionales bacterium RIFOXYD12_FULL_39_22]|nr:MAG: hypothetical protein A2385_15705 [Bdellovibrionales bacterium RIFOXYB1_FULL_39_21]OFZ41550.1 MAG: hypothetical protein A2485_02395 [Bdellovibrionales bacterium RIFOXYC12_FULL_39_17]OFZ45863.1 MAG: hypothetical protein A2404_12760 [Bdellovibrionales bacterium RIFOXYC1_FULL_39_130]OFZ73546.1 MAG: hypothetical protein A2451_01150 [Bdellovibrionales bacterium RIFOXYC2_FULL_39_8]OFZ74795.1 MAG: hypothetical protein A2560_10190 [Bdellovibrionales bacterium RIFOXYD1_FULL_39_84]OFZ92655.1 MAG:
MTKKELEKELLKSIEKHTQIVIGNNDYSTSLANLGIDSVYAAEVANDMEDLLGIVIDDRDIAKFTSITAILEYFDGHIKN